MSWSFTGVAVVLAVLMFGSGVALAACSVDGAARPEGSATQDRMSEPSLPASTVRASSVTTPQLADLDEQRRLCGLNAAMTLGGDDLGSISDLWARWRDDCVGIALQGGTCWPRAEAAMWDLVALGNRAESRALQWDPNALPGLSEDPQAAIWYDVAGDATSAAGRYIDYGCDGGDPPAPPTRRQCYPLYDIIQRHKNLTREYLALADRHYQSADDMGSRALPRSLVGDTLADLMKYDLAQASARLREEAAALGQFAQQHQGYANDLEPYSC